MSGRNGTYEYEEGVIIARNLLSDVMDLLGALGRGDYEGDAPTPRQVAALDEGRFCVMQARNALAPATHRLHG